MSYDFHLEPEMRLVKNTDTIILTQQRIELTIRRLYIARVYHKGDKQKFKPIWLDSGDSLASANSPYSYWVLEGSVIVKKPFDLVEFPCRCDR